MQEEKSEPFNKIEGTVIDDELKEESIEEGRKRTRAKKPKLEEVELVNVETTIKNMEKLGTCLKAGQNSLMIGPTGVGKTSLCYYLAAVTENPVHFINLKDSTDIAEIIGGYQPDSKTGKPRWADGVVTEAVKYGGFLILDEYNLAEPGVLTALNPLLDHRREITLDDHYGEIIRAGTFKQSDNGRYCDKCNENLPAKELIKSAVQPNDKITVKCPGCNAECHVSPVPPPLFIIATQNPTSYSGRKELSADMKNRIS